MATASATATPASGGLSARCRATTVAARVVITTGPRDEAQVDYGGDGPMVRDPITRKYCRARLFVPHAGVLAQSGPPADVAPQRADLGRVP